MVQVKFVFFLAVLLFEDLLQLLGSVTIGDFNLLKSEQYF